MTHLLFLLWSLTASYSPVNAIMIGGHYHEYSPYAVTVSLGFAYRGLYVSGDIETRMDATGDILRWMPTLSSYTVRAGVHIAPITLEVSHTCTHPVLATRYDQPEPVYGGVTTITSRVGGRVPLAGR